MSGREFKKIKTQPPHTNRKKKWETIKISSPFLPVGELRIGFGRNKKKRRIMSLVFRHSPNFSQKPPIYQKTTSKMTSSLFFPFFKPRHPFRPDVRLAAQPKHYGATTTWIKTVKTNAETPQDGQQKLERDVGCAQRTEAGHHHLNC